MRSGVWDESKIEEIAGFVSFEWSAMSNWFEEDEEVFVHARDPYKRVDVLQSSRHVEVLIDGVKVADSSRPRLLFETGLPVRYYLPKTDVRLDLLVDSDTETSCPYKGDAGYWHVRTGDGLIEDIVWGYASPVAESAEIAGYMSFYRGAFVTNQLLGASAVLLGFCATFVDGRLCPTLELLAIVGIFGLVVGGRLCRWRDKAIDYRLVAEQLRHARHLMPLARTVPFTRAPAHGSQEWEQGSWTNWYFRARVRSELPGAAQATTCSLRALRDAFGEDLELWIDDQKKYQDSVSRRGALIHRLLHAFTTGLFAVVAVVVGWHFFEVVVLEHAHAAPALTFIPFAVVVVPAFVAAIHGIQHQAEIEQLAERAAAMNRHLTKELERLRAVRARGMAGPVACATPFGHGLVLHKLAHPATPLVDLLGDEAVRYARAMVEEALDWRAIYFSHETEPS